jgi:hypothetical protein
VAVTFCRARCQRLPTGASCATIAGYIAACAVVGIIATMLMPDRTNRDISQEHA